MSSTYVPAALALMTLTACGARSDIDIPPRPPCTLDRSLAPIDACEEWALGAPQLIDVDSVWALRATWHPDGVGVAYAVLTSDEARHEVRGVVLDGAGAASGPPVVVAGVTQLGGWFLSEPSVAGACELITLGWLISIDGFPGEPRIEEDAALGILTRDGVARTVGLSTDPIVWDLRSSGDELSWLARRRGLDTPLEIVRADRDGHELARTELGVLPVTYGVTRRLGLEDGGFAMIVGSGLGSGTRALVFSESGAPVRTTALSDRLMRHAGELQKDGERWIAWSERPSSPTSFEDPDALHLAHLRADGALAESVSLELGDVRPASTWEIAWRGGSFLVPVIDDERGYVGIFDEAGVRTALLDFGTRFEGAEIIATDGGALVVASERTAVLSPSRTRLIARAMTCVR